MTPIAPSITRREPARVMRLSRLGSFHQSRLSFMRTLTRRMAREKWQFERTTFDVNNQGVGYAVYSVKGPQRSYSLVAFAHDLPADKRSDRVIAEAWDTTFSLFDGIPTQADINRLADNVPYQEAGRISEQELTLSRANRSVRLWSYVVECLASGKQPDVKELHKVGYLMRTTAVYGSGKFGAADREKIESREELNSPFQAELLTVYLIRSFVRDLVQHMARAKGGSAAVQLEPAIAQQLGIGNSTGLGMAPFLVNHPVLFNNWIIAREEAIARVRACVKATAEEVTVFQDIFVRSEASVQRWHSEHPIQQEKLQQLRIDIEKLKRYIKQHPLSSPYPWDELMRYSESHLSEEGQEYIASLMLEPYPHLVDGVTDCMADSNHTASVINGAMPISDVKALLNKSFDWAMDVDWSAKDQLARVWYVSAEKLEPRLGERFEEPIKDYEQPLAPARDAALAYRALESWDVDTPIAAFLLQHPEHRHTIRRAQQSSVAPYGEIRDNTIESTLLPIDMLRAKLSFFGAIHFDPRSDRWVRICMYAGAPYPEELNENNADLWIYPEQTA